MASHTDGESGPAPPPPPDGTSPAPDWQNLAARLEADLAERVTALGGDPARFEQTWATLVDGYGRTEAYGIVHRRAGEILGVRVDLDDAERLAHLARARDNFGESGTGEPSGALPGLPREGGAYRTAGDFALEPHVRAHVEGAAEGMRRHLRAAYDNPVLAEARLHALARDLRDPAALVQRVEQEPALLGALLPGGAPGREPDAANALRAAVAQAQVAYGYHFSASPETAANHAAREAFEVLQRAAANVELAASALDRAIELHGTDLHAYLQRERGRMLGLDPGGGVPGGGGADPRRHPGDSAHEQGPRVAGGIAPTSAAPLPRGDGRHDQAGAPREHRSPRPRDASPAPSAPLADGAVEGAFRATEAVEEIRRLEAYAEQLRGERSSAQAVLSVLNLDETAQLRARRDLAAAAATVYRNPDLALERWEAMLQRHGGDINRASQVVRRDPDRLGPLITERYTDWRRFVPFLTNTTEARAEVPDLVEKARLHAQARKVAEDPVDWTSASGERLTGRGEVRAAAQEVVTSRTADIDRAESAILSRGGAVAEREAQRAVTRLSPEQVSELTRRIGAARGVTPREATAALSRLMATAAARGMKAARVLRAAGEGPGHGL